MSEETTTTVYKIEFLNGRSGYGWLEINNENMAILSIVDNEGEDLTNAEVFYRIIPTE